MFNIKLEEKSYKMSCKALPVKMQQSKNLQGAGGRNIKIEYQKMYETATTSYKNYRKNYYLGNFLFLPSFPS